jgi:hypothetical protein
MGVLVISSTETVDLLFLLSARPQLQRSRSELVVRHCLVRNEFRARFSTECGRATCEGFHIETIVRRLKTFISLSAIRLSLSVMLTGCNGAAF